MFLLFAFGSEFLLLLYLFSCSVSSYILLFYGLTYVFCFLKPTSIIRSVISFYCTSPLIVLLIILFMYISNDISLHNLPYHPPSLLYSFPFAPTPTYPLLPPQGQGLHLPLMSDKTILWHIYVSGAMVPFMYTLWMVASTLGFLGGPVSWYYSSYGIAIPSTPSFP